MGALQQPWSADSGVFDQLHDAVLVFDQALRVAYANRSASEMFGYPIGGLDGIELGTLVPARFRAGHDHSSMEFMRAGRSGLMNRADAAVVGLRLDGTEVPLEISLSTITSEEGPVTVAVARDLSPLLAAREETAKEHDRGEARLSALLHATVDVLVVTGFDGVVLYASDSAREMLGDLDDGLTPDFLETRTHPDDGHAIEQIRAILVGDMAQVEVSARLADRFGDMRHVRVRLEDLSDDELVGGWVWRLHDLTAQRQAEDELAFTSLHDPLTALANRTALTQQLDTILDRLIDASAPIAVLFIDIDRFHNINDTFGYSAGNHVLRTIAERLRQSLRHVDCLARLGGDEFCVILRLDDWTGKSALAGEVAKVSRVARRVLHEISRPIAIGEEQIQRTASIGIAFGAAGRTNQLHLLTDAEAAAGQARSAGGNGFAFADLETRQRAEECHRVERVLRRALDDGRFELRYQPIADLVDGRIQGVEALLRCRDVAGRLMLPEEFLEIADEAGLMGEINSWVLREAVKAAARLREGWPAEHLFVSINTTPRQLSTPGLVGELEALIQHTRIEPDAVIIEVTEHGVMNDIDACQRTLHQLRRLGCRVALDDFGTGYSSLSHLRQLPIDIVKIDRSFISALATDTRDAPAIISAVVAMSRQLGLEALAEGVETREQAATLIELGCRLGQGWLLSAPVPLEEVTVMLPEPPALVGARALR